MDWAITVPKTTKWEDYEKELTVVQEEKVEMLFKVPPRFKAAEPNDRCFVVHDGLVRGWMLVTGIARVFEHWQCTTTGKSWGPGTYLKRSGHFHRMPGRIKMKGFQGIRRFNVGE